MDSDEFRAILSRSAAGIWDVIEAAVRVAASDYGDEFRRRRDGIVESLYAQVCRNCGGGTNADGDREHAFCNRSNVKIDNSNSDDVENDKDSKKFDADELKSNRNFNEGYSSSPLTPESNNRNFSEEEEQDPFGVLFDDEQTKILTIKEQLEDQNQGDDIVIELLQTLADMDITFQALKESDIGRHVNQLRKHPSNEVRRLVKQLVRKWKETVDEWVKVHEPQAASNLIADVDSPQQSLPKYQQNGHHQVFDNGLSPNNPRNGNYAENESKPKPLQCAPRRDRPPQSVPKPVPNRAQKEPVLDDERLNSARKRLQENYEEAQNARKQRKIQVMDIHEIPKPKKGFVPKNKGGRPHHW